VTILDAAAVLAALTLGKVAAFKAAGYAFAVVDTAAHLATLTSARIAASDTNVALTVAQANALETAHVAISAPSGFHVTASDTAANLQTLTAAQVSGLPAIGVSGFFSNNTNVSYRAEQTSAILASGLSVAATGADTVTENFANGNYLVYSRGFLTQQKTGQCRRQLRHPLPQTSWVGLIPPTGVLGAKAQDNTGGTGTLTVPASGVTLTSWGAAGLSAQLPAGKAAATSSRSIRTPARRSRRRARPA